jgi:hypothetical protein
VHRLVHRQSTLNTIPEPVGYIAVLIKVEASQNWMFFYDELLFFVFLIHIRNVL